MAAAANSGWRRNCRNPCRKSAKNHAHRRSLVRDTQAEGAAFRRRLPRGRGLDMNHRVLHLRIARHDAVLDDVRDAMRLVQPHRRVHPDVQIDKDVIGRSARADVVTAEDFGNAAARRALMSSAAMTISSARIPVVSLKISQHA